jgi:hypothetical protein
VVDDFVTVGAQQSEVASVSGAGKQGSVEFLVVQTLPFTYAAPSFVVQVEHAGVGMPAD